MLTKSDKQFLQSTFATKDDLKTFATKGDVASIKQDVTSLKQGVTSLQEDVTSVKKSLKSIEGKLDLTISYFDKITSKHTQRFKRIEEHLGLPPLQEFV